MPTSKKFAGLLLVTLLLVLPASPFFGGARAGGVAVAASRQPVRAPHGMVASTDRTASQVGVDVMRRGGNAVDAAIAVAFALAVVYPAAGNLGGGGFMMIRLRDGRATAIDYREMAPAAAHRDVYLDEKGNLKEGEGSSTLGYRASGVPGTVAGMELALRKYGSGRLTWSQLIEPARRLAFEGYKLPYGLARSLRSNADKLGLYPESKKVYLKGGGFFKEGEVWRQPELAATFARLQRVGPREFYEGRTAQLIAADMRAHGGLITTQDMKNYVAKEREPLRSTYRGFEVVSMPPPSSGGAVLIEILNMLEGFDLANMGALSSERYHVETESMRRAFADRAEYMGDADFVKVPVAGLVDKSYAERLRKGISMQRASTSQEVRAGRPTGAESEETTHFTVVDAAGNCVSNTYTLNDSYGSKVVMRGTGILMNNEMDDFAAKPGTPNAYGLIQGERNAVAPRKRPLSAMTPTFVMRKDGTLWFAVGSPGGPTIINTVMQVITNVVDFDMNIQQAIDAPRIHHQWLPDEITYEPFGLSADTFRALEQKGHRLVAKPRYMGDAQGIMIEEGTGVRLGASDPRNYGEPVGY
ncbi:MAG TPA: gamma-glutamyltransferase [Pyrinomonadaceae bacterium]|nr:gamma-glutamyltransferase [Pyrinomonadaceae bacterium]